MAGDIYNSINVLIGPATLWVDNANMGWTKDGLEIEHSSENYFVEVDQEPSAIKGAKIKETFRVKTNLVELTMENLKIAWGITADIDGTTYAGYRHLGFGGDSGALTEHVLEVRAPAPGTNLERIVHFYKAISVEFGTMTILKTGEAVIPVTFEVLVDPTQTASQQMGYIRDVNPRTSTDLVCRVTVTS